MATVTTTVITDSIDTMVTMAMETVVAIAATNHDAATEAAIVPATITHAITVAVAATVVAVLDGSGNQGPVAVNKCGLPTLSCKPCTAVSCRAL